jgi:hypothetical protein
LPASNDLGDPVQTFAEQFELAIANGTGADQANNVFSDERTIAASGTDNLDLAGVLGPTPLARPYVHGHQGDHDRCGRR